MRLLFTLVISIIICGCSTDDVSDQWSPSVDVSVHAAQNTVETYHVVPIHADVQTHNEARMVEWTWVLYSGTNSLWVANYGSLDTTIMFTQPGEYTVAFRYIWKDPDTGDLTTDKQFLHFTVTDPVAPEGAA